MQAATLATLCITEGSHSFFIQDFAQHGIAAHVRVAQLHGGTRARHEHGAARSCLIPDEPAVLKVNVVNSLQLQGTALGAKGPVTSKGAPAVGQEAVRMGPRLEAA